MKKIVFTLLFMCLPSMLFAAGDSQEVSDKILSTFKYYTNIVGPIVTIFVIGFKGGFSYMAKDKDERSAEDGKELRQLALRVIVGAALVIGAINIGPELWELLGGN